MQKVGGLHLSSSALLCDVISFGFSCPTAWQTLASAQSGENVTWSCQQIQLIIVGCSGVLSVLTRITQTLIIFVMLSDSDVQAVSGMLHTRAKVGELVGYHVLQTS